MGENALRIGARPGLLTRAFRRICLGRLGRYRPLSIATGWAHTVMATLLVAAGTSVDDLNLLRIL